MLRSRDCFDRVEFDKSQTYSQVTSFDSWKHQLDSIKFADSARLDEESSRGGNSNMYIYKGKRFVGMLCPKPCGIVVFVLVLQNIFMNLSDFEFQKKKKRKK